MKQRFVLLDLTIPADIEKGQTDAFVKIEKCSHYLFSLFNSMKDTAELLEESAETVEVRRFLSQIQTFCDFGLAIRSQIQNANNNETDFDELGKDGLVIALSQILNNPNLPIKMYNALTQGISLAITNGDNEIMSKLETSPEYLRALFEANE